MSEIKLLSPARVAAFLNVSRVTVWRLRQSDPTFPKPLQVSARRIAFRADELNLWLETRRRSS